MLKRKHPLLRMNEFIISQVKRLFHQAVNVTPMRFRFDKVFKMVLRVKYPNRSVKQHR